MSSSWLLAHLLLGGVALGLAFLLAGALRALRASRWRLEQLEIALCGRLGRSKRYQMYATPFAFLIDERGVIASRGIVNNGQHIDFVLSGAVGTAKNGQAEAVEAGVA